MSAIQNAAAGTAAASFVASQIGNSIAGTFGMGYAKLVVGQAAWAASVGALGEKMANGTATGGDYANVIQKTGDLLLGLGLTIAQVNPWIRGAFTIASGGLFIYDNWDKISDFYDRAKTWVWPRDPIILDLDGDGLETVGLASNVYFDHDGDGVLTRTGWAGKDDALLVWDRNGNGRIDTGAELFGDFTPLLNGTLAPNGFAALAALDANGDGVIDASDPAFAELKLWRDADQNGATGAGELISLADAGILSMNLANTLKNQNLANGNQLTREGSFTRTDGTTSAMGEFRLATDTFSTKFANAIEVPESLKSLPDMQGSGSVRELWQAAAQSGSVAAVLAQFQSAATRAEQKALLDTLITAWADTSGMAGSLEARASGKYRIVYEAFGNERRSSSIDTVAFAAISSGSVSGSAGLMSDAGGLYLSERYRNLISDWSRKLHVLEAFNGQYFFNLPEQKSQTAGANWGLAISAGSGGGGSSGGDGGAGNDLLIGSTGWNWIYENGSYRVERNTTPSISANGNDTYLFGGGDGQDTVIDGDYTAGNSDTLRFKEWVAPTDVKLIRSGEDLVLACKGRRWRDGEAANKAWRIAA